MTTPTDILRQAINYELSNVHTCLPARIVSYDYTRQKADVQPLLNKRYKTNQPQGEILPMPQITNVPVIFPRTAEFSIHFPIKEGDLVMLLFSERSIDLWLTVGGQVTPQDPRKFDLSDAIALVGLYPFSEASPAEDNENFILKFQDAKVKISPDGKYCVHGQTEELMNILDELFIAIQAITVAADQGGVPNPTIPINNAATFASLQTRFNTLKGDC